MNYTQRPKGRRSSGYKAPKAEKPASSSEKSGEKDEKPSRKKMSLFKKIRNAILPVKGDPPTEAVRKIIFDIAVIALIITGGSLLYDVIDRGVQIAIVDKQVEQLYKPNNTITGQINLDDVNLSDEEKDAVLNEQPQIMPSFMELYNKNSDIVGWLTIGEGDKTIVNHPVMQAADNDYYLERNFNRESTKSGALFADFRNTFTPTEISGNTIIYGHNIWDGSMFAKLTRYYDARLNGDYSDRLGFYKENPTFTFNTLYEEAEWKVFACVLFNTDDNNGEVYPYMQIHDFETKESFNSYILDIMDRSVLWTDVDLTYGDSILTLSTCYYPYGKKIDTRCVVFARKVRENESAEVDVSKAMTNNNPLKFTYQYNVEGGSWQGRTWDTSKLLSY
ncbi:MAG: class B sortase [Ruminiclostridium sp.]|nr:class B sortase [Ruminiclostridium sp.]